jgi:hypothetical protein
MIDLYPDSDESLDPVVVDETETWLNRQQY